MAWRGRYILGERLPLAVLCRTGAGAPSVPDAAPAALLFSDSGLVTSVRLPVVDRQDLDGFFALSFLLDSRFTTGLYRVVYQYAISSVAGSDADTFEIVPGGNADGAGLALTYYARPASDFVVLQTDSGRLIRRRNPRL